MPSKPALTDIATADETRLPMRLADLEGRWKCGRTTVWRIKQDPRFPKIFRIGSRPYVWLDELMAFEEVLAAVPATSPASA